MKKNQIDNIFIVNGPGSFTGTRIGVTVAKVMAWSLNIDIIPISSLEIMASYDSDKKYVCSFIDARRGFVFAGVYDKELNTYMEDKAEETEDKAKEEAEKAAKEEAEKAAKEEAEKKEDEGEGE